MDKISGMQDEEENVSRYWTTLRKPRRSWNFKQENFIVLSGGLIWKRL
jgi:hypothetical protein